MKTKLYELVSNMLDNLESEKEPWRDGLTDEA